MAMQCESQTQIAQRCSHLRPLSPIVPGIQQPGRTLNAARRSASVPVGGEGQISNSIGTTILWAAMGCAPTPERWAKLSDVVISNKMQELSGTGGLAATLAVPPYVRLRSPDVSGTS
jgi:hypothetical protein